MQNAAPVIPHIDPLDDMAVFDLSTAGITEIFRNSNYDCEIVELYIWCVGANTFQLASGGIAKTPVYNFPANAGIAIPGLYLQRNLPLTLTLGGSGEVQGHIRFRVRQH